MIASVVFCLFTDLARAIRLSVLRWLRSFDRAMTASAVSRELNALPDALLRDMGVARSNIGYVARVLAARRGDRSSLRLAAVTRSSQQKMA